MSIITQVYAMRKRLKEADLEKLINILEDERKRRSLERDDDLVCKRPKEIRR